MGSDPQEGERMGGRETAIVHGRRAGKIGTYHGADRKQCET